MTHHCGVTRSPVTPGSCDFQRRLSTDSSTEPPLLPDHSLNPPLATALSSSYQPPTDSGSSRLRIDGHRSSGTATNVMIIGTLYKGGYAWLQVVPLARYTWPGQNESLDLRNGAWSGSWERWTEFATWCTGRGLL